MPSPRVTINLGAALEGLLLMSSEWRGTGVVLLLSTRTTRMCRTLGAWAEAGPGVTRTSVATISARSMKTIVPCGFADVNAPSIGARYTRRRDGMGGRAWAHSFEPLAGRYRQYLRTLSCFDTETTMGALLRLASALLIVAVIVGFFMGYRIRDGRIVDPSGAAATAGKINDVDTAKAREAGATIGDKVAVGAKAAAQHALANATLTGKIKAKITLDDTLQGASVGVDSNDGAVTLSGTVPTAAQHARVLQLTKETDGVKSVTDHLAVR